jgi:hypothetical protein
MTVVNQDPPKMKMSGKEKWLFAGLLILQVPMGIVFIPLAAVLILPGFLAPFGLLCFAIGTKPFSIAMKIRSGSRSSGGSTNDEHRQNL